MQREQETDTKALVLIIPAVVLVAAGCGASPNGTLAGYTDTWQDVKVGYSGNGSTPATRARAFSLRVSADGGTILAIKGYPASGGKGYSIYPGSITVNADTGLVKNYGMPVEPDRIDETGHSALGSSQIIVVMCSLYKNDADAPPAHSDLFTVTIDRRCDVTITPEIRYRGGVVSEEGRTISVAPITLAATAGQPTGEAAAASAPNTAAFRIVCDGWADSRTSRELSGTRWKPTESGAGGVRLTPAQRAVVSHWLSTSTVADYTGDGICNVSDWARACRDDFLKRGVIWGRTSKAFAENLWIYICESREREKDIISGSREHRDLVQTRSDWTRSHADRSRLSK